MSTATSALHNMPAGKMSAGKTLNIYVTEAMHELLKVSRMPAYVLPTLTFPLLFYVMFGLLFGTRQNVGSVNLATYLLGTYGTFGVMGASLFGFAVGVSTERGFGWLQVKRASPMPPMAYLTAKLFVSSIFSAIVVCMLLFLGTMFGGAHLSLLTMLKFVGVLVAGALPFAAMGLAIGCWVAPNSAPGIVNVLFLPMSFCSGLWLPLQILPRLFHQIAPMLPPYHLAQLALNLVGAPNYGTAIQHVAALAAFTVGFLLLARRGFTREDVNVNA
jgi:ABC-2 type transport system permease protein